MKTTPQIQDLKQRPASDPRPERMDRSFPRTDHNYQCVTLLGSCGTPAQFRREPAFFRISSEYFAEEAARSFVVETGVFAALILTVLPPIVNSVQAIATLIHTLGVL